MIMIEVSRDVKRVLLPDNGLKFHLSTWTFSKLPRMSLSPEKVSY